MTTGIMALGNELTKLFDKNHDIARLATQIAAYEKRLGPLKALGRTTGKTAATYTIGRPPTPAVELVTGNGAPNGYDKICSGGVWISGQPQDVSAVRKRPSANGSN
jgi:hypothetical protein